MLSLRSYDILITKELIFGFQILDLKDHFSASLIAPEDKINKVLERTLKPGFHIVVLGLRQSFRIVYSCWLFESFWIVVWFPSWGGGGGGAGGGATH